MYLRLSDYEKRVYEILLSEGPSTATKISALSNVLRTKIYKVLERLVEIGTVSEIPLKPRCYIALPPKEAFKPILEAQKVIQRSLYTLIFNLQKKYEESMHSTHIVREEFWIFTGQEALEKASKFLSQAEKNICDKR
ncbi:MAG: helix-turn-helix domain-containing protein [Candidatus Bathyarchaeia archaeon]